MARKKRQKYYNVKVKDLNKLAKKGIHFCASCGKQMRRHDSGHCTICRKKGY